MDKTILVVEDERPIQAAVAGKLEREGLHAASARTIDQARGYLEDLVQVDAVWLDHYLLGEKTGLDLLAFMRENEKYRSIPVFVVSNTGSSDKSITYMKLGATKYYVKADHRLDEIIAAIKEHLEELNR